jgi:glutamate N-acetyltransferase/amino-acid N-acetyltransferase
MPFDCNEEKASAILDKEDLLITIDLQQGKEEFKMYTCDLSHDYITINADYRS